MSKVVCDEHGIVRGIRFHDGYLDGVLSTDEPVRRKVTERLYLDAEKVTKPGVGVLRLVISDHPPWDEGDDHLRILQEKINTYIAFVESGQVFRIGDPNITRDSVMRIEVVMRHAPTVEAQAFFARGATFLAGIGLELETRVATAGPDEPA